MTKKLAIDFIRKSRAKQQKIYLIECLPFDKIIDKYRRSYAVMGSTGNVYNVTIDNSPSCTCPDFQTRHKRCKHIYFILIRVMHVNQDCEDKSVFTKRALTKMFKNIPNISNCGVMIDNKLKSKYNKKIKKIIIMIKL